MAHFLDLKGTQLLAMAQNGPALLREGLTGTRTYVYQMPEQADMGFIIEFNAQRRVLGTWTISQKRSYRITPQKVISMPYPENDPKHLRRFCREYGLALTRVKYVKRDEDVYLGSHLHQRDSNYRSIGQEDSPVKFVGLKAVDGYKWVILAIESEIPASYQEVLDMLRQSSQGLLQATAGIEF